MSTSANITSLECAVASTQSAIESKKREIAWYTGQLCGITDKKTIELRKNQIKKAKAEIAVLKERLRRQKEDLKNYKRTHK